MTHTTFSRRRLGTLLVATALAPFAPAAVQEELGDSDPGAIQFVRKVVDTKVYNLKTAGAATFHARFRCLITGQSNVPDPTRGSIEYDYDTGESKVILEGEGTGQDASYMESFLEFVTMPGYGRMAEQARVKMVPDGDELRIEATPYDPSLGIDLQVLRITREGIPLQQFTNVTVPNDGSKVRIDSYFEYETVGQYNLMSRMIQTSPLGGAVTHDFEYDRSGGFTVMKKVSTRSSNPVLTTVIELSDIRIEDRRAKEKRLERERRDAADGAGG